MNAKIAIALLVFLINFRLCLCKSYDNYTLYSSMPTEPDHLKFLQTLGSQKYIDVFFWRKPLKLYDEIQFIVNSKDLEVFLERAHHFNLEIRMLLNDVQTAFNLQSPKNKYYRLQDETFSWYHYHSLDEINQWLADMALKHPSIVQLQSIGKSSEGRDIYAVGIKKTPEVKHVVIVEGGIHGHEWIAIEFVTFLIDQLLHNHRAEDSRLGDLAKKYHWYIIPVLNPDGYNYNQKVDRLWKKNRRSTGNAIGVDLNRNFGYKFGLFDASKNPKDDNYCGPNQFSEPETKAMSNFVSRKQDKIKFYFAFHGYGQKFIIPYGDTVQHIENYFEMENLAKQAMLRIYKTTGNKYSVGTSYDTLGLKKSGDSTGWVKKFFKAQYVFEILLRDNGTTGYALSPQQIMPTCKEALVGLVELMTAKPRPLGANIFNLSSASAIKAELTILLACSFVLLQINLLGN